MKQKNGYTEMNIFERGFAYLVDNFFGAVMVLGGLAFALLMFWLISIAEYQNSDEGVTERCLAYELFTEQECETIVKWERISNE